MSGLYKVQASNGLYVGTYGKLTSRGRTWRTESSVHRACDARNRVAQNPKGMYAGLSFSVVDMVHLARIQERGLTRMSDCAVHGEGCTGACDVHAGGEMRHRCRRCARYAYLTGGEHLDPDARIEKEVTQAWLRSLGADPGW